MDQSWIGTGIAIAVVVYVIVAIRRRGLRRDQRRDPHADERLHPGSGHDQGAEGAKDAAGEDHDADRGGDD